ncbi:MAG: L-rhamnonate dehydratase [Anaerolineae bacterium]|nr:L-rhamnonate dehydratase [Anaerolineae bacterium]
MKIADISIVRADIPRQTPATPARRAPWHTEAEVANPMSRYPKVKRHRSLWVPQWEQAWCKVTAENGAWGLGLLWPARPLVPVVEHLAAHLTGEDCLAIEKLADMMFRLTKPYGSTGLASYAISALDLALWDLTGKLFDKPVYSLLGGPQKERLFCYATGNDVDWYLELGFKAFKLACPYGPADGLDGIHRNEAFVAQARETIGDDCELMLDCWMAFDVEYTVRLAETLRPYRLKWIEEYLAPEDFDSHAAVRERLPWQTLATGEHWYTHYPFQWAIKHKVVDILQPDINWCGGLTTCRKVANTADAAGLSVILHAGAHTPYGQHFSYAMPATPWIECFVGTAPGVPLEEAWRQVPGQAVPKDGWLVPNDAPGFGLGILENWLEPFQ